MAAPIASDLQMFIGAQTIDEDRAYLMLSLAEMLCCSIVNPLPDEATVVILAVASRAFVNPDGITSETVGPYTVQRQAAGLYLTKADKATLRRLAGGTAAFSIDPMPSGVDAVQALAVSATAGTYTLALTGQATTPIAWDALAPDIQAAISALSLVGTGNVTVSGTGPFTITFVREMGHCPVSTLVVDETDLNGTAVVMSVTRGIFRPGADLPYWDRDFGRRGRRF